MEDVNKNKRVSLWVIILVSLITIPILNYFDNKPISEHELETVQNLTIAEDSYYSGGKRPAININVADAEKTLILNLEELICVQRNEILNNFKKGDIISIKIFRSSKSAFYESSSIKKFEKIYGLNKNGKDFIELSCRNSVAARETKAAIYACIATSVLGLFLALFIFKPKTNQQAKRQIKIDPVLTICICWLLIYAIFRWI